MYMVLEQTTMLDLVMHKGHVGADQQSDFKMLHCCTTQHIAMQYIRRLLELCSMCTCIQDVFYVYMHSEHKQLACTE